MHAQRETLTSTTSWSSTKISTKLSQDILQKGKTFCTCGVILQEVSAEKTKTSKETTAQVIIRPCGLQWQTRTRGLSRHVRTAKHHLRKVLNKNFEGCADRWKSDADCRKCMQEEGCASETEGETHSHVDLGKPTE